MNDRCAIVELRQYTLHAGGRDVLIDLFDREFIETQEAVGMTVIGQFRVLGEPDRFVWLRGFTDMTARDRGLRTFYGGPVWREHRAAANATMIDSDNVLLLRPARPGSGFALPPSRNGDGTAAATPARRIFVAHVHAFETPIEVDFAAHLERAIVPLVADEGGRVVASFVTERSPNSVPALPVRENENASVWFAAFDGAAAAAAHVERVRTSQAWHRVLDPFASPLRDPLVTLVLEPTSRSWLH